MNLRRPLSGARSPAPPLESDGGAGENDTRRYRRKQWMPSRWVVIAFSLASCLFGVWYFGGFGSTVPFKPTVRLEPSIAQGECEPFTFRDDDFSGFTETPVDSTVLMLYTPASRAAPGFCYSDEDGAANATVEREFLRVAASYVTSPHAKPSSPYHDFFGAHDATLWTVDRAARVAEPMRLDVAYTYVNPSAPSFERHLKMRRVPFEQRRYRDWEELRYSLRSLRAFMLESDALAQHHRRHEADVRLLSEMGYRVDAGDAGAGGVVPLVRHVYLIVSDVDQVPAWLDAERFPQLRVVTHRDMFTAEEAAWVLPTMNSNVIESGMHRIPGISRFFLYFTNDMLVARKMSFFDLFRPLSPMRQRLHLYDLALGETKTPTDATQPGTNRERAALLFEPVVHSDTQSVNEVERQQATVARATARSKATMTLQSCFYRDAREVVLANSGKNSWSVQGTQPPIYSTTDVFALPDPHQHVDRGKGVSSRYFHFIASQRINGVQPPFGYAHVPQLIDREVYLRLQDVELFDLTNASRRAYEREMSPYGGINLYAVFAVAMARAAERRIWNTAWRDAPEGFLPDVREQMRSWWWRVVGSRSKAVVAQLLNAASHKMDLSMFGPLYGTTWAAQLQRPDLALEMGYWWVRGVVSPAPPVRDLPSLKAAYAIPAVASNVSCPAPPSSQPPAWAPRSDDHYYSLLHDMFHHTRRDETFLFEMVDSEVKTLLVAARLKYEWTDRPLFIGLNDNFPQESSYREIKVALAILMDVVAGSHEAAVWER